MWLQRKKSILTAGLLLGGAGSAHAQVWLPSFQPAFVGQTTSVTVAPQSPVVVDSDGRLQVIDGTRKIAKFHDGCAGTRRGLDAAPFGESVTGHFQTQVTNGVAARMTLYDFDFVCGGSQLNYRGSDRLRQIACMMPHNEFPVVIQPTPFAPGLAEARRQAVINELTTIAPLPPERVVVSTPSAVPLQGTQAMLIYGTLLTQTRSAGALPKTGVETLSAGSGSNSSGGGGAGAIGSR